LNKFERVGWHKAGPSKINDFCFYYMLKTNFSGHNKVREAENFRDTAPKCPLWLRARHKVEVASKFQQICRLLTGRIVVLEHILIQIYSNTYIIGFYHFMRVSYTFAEAELLKAALQ